VQYKTAWYALVAVAIVLILFELFFRYRYLAAGNRLWRIDRLTEKACIVRVGDALCSAPSSAPSNYTRPAGRNPYLVAPTSPP
jgi:hypothetical protein